MITFDKSRFELNPYVATFIKENIDLIDNNEFEQLYEIATKELEIGDVKWIHNLTEALYMSGIDPLDYMEYVPPYFLYTSICVEHVVIPEEVYYIDQFAFAESDIKSIKTSSSVEKIKYSAFSDCVNLETVELADGLKEIYANTFEYCEKISTLKLPDTVQHLGDGALYGCWGLKDLDLSKNLRRIEGYNFDVRANKGIIIHVPSTIHSRISEIVGPHYQHVLDFEE